MPPAAGNLAAAPPGAGIMKTPTFSAPSISSNDFQWATSEMRPMVLAVSPRMKPSYSSMNFAVELAPFGNQPALLASTQDCSTATTCGLVQASLPAAKSACSCGVHKEAAIEENQNSIPNPSLLPRAMQGTVPLARKAAQTFVRSSQ